MSKDLNLDEVGLACQAFSSQFQTVQLGTVSADGFPEASYAPYVSWQGRYFVYLSDLARHTQNLLAKPHCSVLFIESEKEAANVFARKRLTLRCTSEEWMRGSKEFEVVLDYFSERFGKFFGVLRDLKDFHLFALSPTSGSYVAGFAKAYTLSGQDLGQISHRNDQGHQAPNAAAQKRLDQEVTP